MSEAEVAVVRRWLDASADALNSGAGDAFAAVAERFMAPGVVYEEDPVWPDAGVYRGRDATVRRFLEYRDLVHLDRIAPGEVIDATGMVVAQVRIEMLGGDRGGALDFVWTYTVRVEGGQITYFRAWYDREEGARAAGLAPRGAQKSGASTSSMPPPRGTSSRR
jgi:ketosteroid isomerase-like protein